MSDIYIHISKANKPRSATWFKRQNIDRAARRRKHTQHLQNLLNRAEINRARSNSPLSNPTFHGQGYHALGKVRQTKRRTSYRRKMENQSLKMNP